MEAFDKFAVDEINDNRYKRIPLQTFDVMHYPVVIDAYHCYSCGCLVISRTKHEEWHRRF